MLLLELGWAVLEVWWDAGGWDDSEAWLRTNAEAARRELAATYEPAVLVGRSIGTWALSTLDDERAKRVWIAPLLQLERVWAAVERHAARSWLLIGTADPAFDEATLEQLRSEGVGVALIEGGDHARLPGRALTG